MDIENEIKYLESNDFIKNEFSQFIYANAERTHIINLAYILEDYKQSLIEKGILIDQKKIDE